MTIECPFCKVSAERIAFANDRSMALWDAYPVTEGHILIVPKRHVASWGSLDSEERLELLDGTEAAQRLLREKYPIDGFNIGFNEGAAAGQTVPHFHIHVIPRRHGDMADPRGGVRHVIPAKGNYLVPAEPSASQLYASLARHGVNITEVLTTESGVGEALLAQVAELESDLLVMGCYGRFRLSELIFGGATRYVLKHMTVPVLMSY